MEFTPQELAILGAVTAMAGVGLVVWGAQAMARSRSYGPTESLLAPTLAVDALDPDLRIAYMRTLVVDARESTRAAPSTIGRELRRALVALQATRFAGLQASDEEHLLRLVDEVADAAEALDERPRDHQLTLAREFRHRLLLLAQDPQE